MATRVPFAIVLFILAVTLAVCSFKARRSGKAIGNAVANFIASLIPPVTGNMLIIISSNYVLSLIGCYMYYVGMDFVMIFLIQFTISYCRLEKKRKSHYYIAYTLLLLDAVQLLLNPFFGHAFTTESIMFEGRAYYRLIPFVWQNVHRALDYAIVAVAMIVFLVKLIKAARIESERYSVIFAAMVFTTIWESLYIFSGTPVDRAMIGFGVFGLLVYFLSIVYRPLRLLDRMLAIMASELPEALFFFDSSNQCIWVNSKAIELAGLEEENYEGATESLHQLFGEYDKADSERYTIPTKDNSKSYVFEEHNVNDDKGRKMGYFLSVRDNTEEQEALKKEIYNATHDSLTSVYNRAGYNFLLSTLDLSKTYMLVIDVDEFKEINDMYGHEIGDKVLLKITNTLKHYFRSDDYICRIGGDEFVVFMAHSSEDQEKIITDRIERINADLENASDGIPPVTVSVGAVLGKEGIDAKKMFDYADVALYDRKRNGKNGITFY